MKNLKILYDNFKNQRWSIEELQSRIETMVIPEEHARECENVKMNILNDLEEIRFCKLEENHYKSALEVLQKFLK